MELAGPGHLPGVERRGLDEVGRGDLEAPRGEGARHAEPPGGGRLVRGGCLVAGDSGALLNAQLDPSWETVLYYVLKLYLAMWYIALYTLFWNYTDTYFDIQDAKRLFPLFAAFCALGTATGALVVSLFAASVPMHYFLLLWSIIAFATAPLARMLRWIERKWPAASQGPK